MCASPSLLQTDLQHSVLSAMPRGGPGFIAYTVYGASPVTPAGPFTGFDGVARENCVNGYLLGNGYRVYSPVLMRFYSADQMSPFEQGGINTYAYCHGDPVNFRDDSGRMPGKQRLGRKISPEDFQFAQLDGLLRRAVNLKLKIKDLGNSLMLSQEVLVQNISSSSAKPSAAEIALRETMVDLYLRKQIYEESLMQVSQQLKMLSPPESQASSDTESSGSVPPSPGLLNVQTMNVRGSSTSAGYSEGSNRFF